MWVIREGMRWISEEMRAEMIETFLKKTEKISVIKNKTRNDSSHLFMS